MNAGPVVFDCRPLHVGLFAAPARGGRRLRPFVRGVTPDSGNANLLSAVIGMGRSQHLQGVAQALKRATSAHFLRQLHCDDGQQPADRLAALRGQGSAHPVASVR